MRLFRPHGGLRIAGLSLMLLLVVLAITACASAAPSLLRNSAAPTTTLPTVAPTAVKEPAGPLAPGSGGEPAGKAGAAPMGVDADGNFYRGDPQASVKIVEFSDFQ